jgi:peptide/nickel transport system permease protein
MRYLAVRFLQSVFVLLGVSVLSFAFLELAPGDFFQEMRLNPQISPNTVARLRAEYGLDKPMPVRYVRWLASAVRGDFGFSFAYGSPVAPLLLTRARNTLLLAGTATFLVWVLAVSLGVFCAARPGSWIDHGCSLLTSTLLAIPELLLALCFLALGVRSGRFPAGGMVSPGFEDFSSWHQITDLLWHLVLPVVVLVLGSLPVLLRHVRAAVLEVLDSPFIRAALGHGIHRRRVLFFHALPAAINPLVSLFGFSLASLMSVSLLTEVIMSWPGLGPLLLEAVLAHDVYVVVGAVTFSALFLVVGTALADLLLYAGDPRIRSEALI